MAKVREYDVSQSTQSGVITAWTRNRDNDPTITRFSPIPTLEEVQAVLGPQIEKLRLWGCFNPNNYAKALPKAPPVDTLQSIDAMYSYTDILVAPPLPKMACDSPLEGCPNMLIPAVIPKEVTDANHFYSDCEALLYPVSLHKDVADVYCMYRGCINMTGEMILRMSAYPSGSDGSYMFRDTTKEIILYGDQTVCQAAAATANNHNVTWAPWYDPVQAVTNRGQGSYTTAEDMTRMVRNGALAVNTYAPGRMVYQQGDIVREDEWEALVEAAQTIDPTVTYSTHYANLNRIEAAFDSAL